MKKIVEKILDKFGYVPKSKIPKEFKATVVNYGVNDAYKHQCKLEVTRQEMSEFHSPHQYQRLIIDRLKSKLYDAIEPEFFCKEIDGGWEYSIELTQIKKNI